MGDKVALGQGRAAVAAANRAGGTYWGRAAVAVGAVLTVPNLLAMNDRHVSATISS